MDHCAHCTKPATKKWRLLGGDGPMGFGHQDVCDEHYEAERAHRYDVLRDALAKMRGEVPRTPPRGELMGATHGLPSTYRDYGCRCGECRRANTDRHRADRKRMAERLAADPTLAPHGKYTTYRNWGCRCAPCSQAHSERCAEYKRRRSR